MMHIKHPGSGASVDHLWEEPVLFGLISDSDVGKRWRSPRLQQLWAGEGGCPYETAKEQLTMSRIPSNCFAAD